MMKRIVVLVLILCLFTVSCTNGQNETVYNSKELAVKIVSDYGLEGGYYYSSFSTEYGEYLDSDTLLSFYGDMGEVPDMNSCTEYCVYMDSENPNLQKEFGIFKLQKDADKELFLSFMRSRIDAKLENAKNYPSVDREPLQNAQFFTVGDYVCYVVIKTDANNISDFIKDALK